MSRQSSRFMPLNQSGAPSTVSANLNSDPATSRDGARRFGSWVGIKGEVSKIS